MQAKKNDDKKFVGRVESSKYPVWLNVEKWWGWLADSEKLCIANEQSPVIPRPHEEFREFNGKGNSQGKKHPRRCAGMCRHIPKRGQFILSELHLRGPHPPEMSGVGLSQHSQI